MRHHRTLVPSLRHLFWSRETYRILFAGLLAWAGTSALLVWMAGRGFDYMYAHTLRATALAGGFGAGAVTVVVYGTLRFLADGRRLNGAIGAIAIYALPVLFGIFLPGLLLTTPGARFAAHSGRMLEVGLFLPVFAHAAFAAARASAPGRPLLRRLGPAAALLVLALGLLLGPIGGAASPAADITAAIAQLPE